MVREAVLSAVPIERKTPVRERPKLEPAMAFIDAVLEARSIRWFDTARTVAGPRTLAGQFRSLLGDAEAAQRPAAGNARHDRGALAGPTARLPPATSSD